MPRGGLRPCPPAASGSLVRLHQIDRRGAAVLLLLDIEADLLAFVQAAQTRLLHGTDMDEDVFSSGVRRDEPVAFGRIEPLHGALGHQRAAFLPASSASRNPGAAQSEQRRQEDLISRRHSLCEMPRDCSRGPGWLSTRRRYAWEAWLATNPAISALKSPRLRETAPSGA